MVRAWVVTLHLYHVYVSWAFQCPHGLELLLGLQLAASQQAQFQCPHGLELLRIGRWYCIIFYSVSMPSRAYTSFLPELKYALKVLISRCQCPLGLIPHFYDPNFHILNRVQVSVNALSGLYLISTISTGHRSGHKSSSVNALSGLYLISTSGSPERSLMMTCVNALSGLYLISTW